MKRLGSILKKFAFALVCLVTLVFLLYQWENWRGWRAWKQYKTQVEQAGLSLDPKSVIPPEIPEASNFAAIPLFTDLFHTNQAPGETQGETATEHQSPSVALLEEFRKAYDKAGDRPLNVSNSFMSATTMDLRGLLAALSGSEEAVQDARPAGTMMETPEIFGNEQVKLIIDTNMPIDRVGRELLGHFEKFDSVFQQLERAAPRPMARYPIAYEKQPPFTVVLPHLQKMRTISWLLKARGMAAIAAGQGDLAFGDLRLILRLAESLRSEPTLISYLVRLALLNQSLDLLAQGIANQAWSEQQLAQLQGSLLEINVVEEQMSAMHAETVYFGLAGIDYLRRHPGEAGQMMDDPGVFWMAKAMPDGWHYREMINYHRLAGLIGRASDPAAKTINPELADRAQQDIEAGIGSHPVAIVRRHTFWSRMLLPAVSRVTARTAKTQAAVTLAGVACALERHRLRHSAYPENLDEIKPLLEGRQVHDVILGKPLHYRPEPPSGYVVYSVGWNRTNENGHVELKRKGQSESLEGDWAWRPIPPLQSR
jgi:hypothetical protein